MIDYGLTSGEPLVCTGFESVRGPVGMDAPAR